MRLSWLFVSGPFSRPHKRCEKSESLSVSWERWVISGAQPWLLNQTASNSLFPCLSISHRLTRQVLLQSQIVNQVAWQNFLVKQDQLSSRRSAGRTFIGFITTQGTVQRQHVCNPSLPCCYVMTCPLRYICHVLNGKKKKLYQSISAIAGFKKTRLL